jgi:phosphoglycerol transferase MdoB-like AlkP superfamily enzyme
MTYDYPSTINMTEGMPSIFEYLNEVTFQWFSNSILIAIWLITLIFYYKSRGELAESLAVAGFLSSIVALLLWLGDFLSGITLTITITITLLSVAFLIFDRK